VSGGVERNGADAMVLVESEPDSLLAMQT